jgi:DNA polymerase-1
MSSIIAEAQTKGYISTYWGRRRYIANINQRNSHLAHEAQRVAINSVIQGTAADIVKRGMIKTHTVLGHSAHNASIILQIHDEIIVHAPIEQVSRITAQVKETLEQVVSDWNVPLKVTIRTGDSWKEVSK